MKIFKLAFLGVLLFIIIATTVSAQDIKIIDSLSNKLNLYGIKNQSPVLFIHFDKNVYANNEQIWFTGYLFNADHQHKTLSIALVKNDDRSIVMEDKFAIKNSFTFGNAIVPDSLQPGPYTLIATTNRLKNGQPAVIFTQPVTIKTSAQQGFTASLNPLDTSLTSSEKKILLLTKFRDDGAQQGIKNSRLPPARINYYVGNSLHPVAIGSGNIEGDRYVFNIPSKLITQGNNTLHVQVIYKNEVKELNMLLPVPTRPAMVNFYPEGGNMVNNLPGVVGVEIKSATGAPLGVSAILYQDGKPIDTVETNTYGMGKFTLAPRANSSYYMKLYNTNNKKDTLYRLPAAIMYGPTMALQKAIVNDTLIVDLYDERKEKLYLIGHNYHELFFVTPVTMTDINKRIRFIIKDIPKGLTQLTLTDSLGRPFAGRLFFAHSNRKNSLSITTDKSEYSTRQRVNVKIKLDTDIPDSGFVSVACVQENRIEIKKKKDIESYIYLTRELEDVPARETYLSQTEGDKQFMENIMLIKGWRKYSWTDVLKSRQDDTIAKMEDLLFKGTVMKFNKPLKKSVDMVMLENMSVIPTDMTGNYALSDAELVTAQGKKLTLIVNNDNSHDYNIRLTDPYVAVNKNLALQFKDYNIIGQESSNRYLQVPLNERVVQLKEVKIIANNDHTFFGKDRSPNACGDYVCLNNILNCQYHRTDFQNRPAVVGQTYITKGALLTYTACSVQKLEYMPSFKGIYEAQEFYPANHSEINSSLPENLSTLFWKHQLKVSSIKNSEFEFYTSDITGMFKIVVQGITGNDVTYGETSFNVIKQ